MAAVRNFLRFWYDFIVGDDWRIAVAVVVGLGITRVLTGHNVPAWWLLPLAVISALSLSLWLVARAVAHSATPR